MNGDLDLPPAVALPPDVRQRALHAVLQQIEDDDVAPSARRRRAPFLAAAAAVVTTLVASSVVAIAGAGPQLRTATPPSPGASPQSSPAAGRRRIPLARTGGSPRCWPTPRSSG